MPASWLVSLDAIVSVGCLISVLAFWQMWSRFWREPQDLAKMIIGCLISATAPLLLALASMQEAATGQKIGLGWGLAFHIVNDIGFVNVYGVGMALFSRVAPKSLSGVMIAVYYFYLAFGNELAGRLGGLLESMGPIKFWLLHAGLSRRRRHAAAVRPCVRPLPEGRARAGSGRRASGGLSRRQATPASIARRTRSAVRATPSLDLIWLQRLAAVL